MSETRYPEEVLGDPIDREAWKLRCPRCGAPPNRACRPAAVGPHVERLDLAVLHLAASDTDKINRLEAQRDEARREAERWRFRAGVYDPAEYRNGALNDPDYGPSYAERHPLPWETT